jgi:hypothetical protein
MHHVDDREPDGSVSTADDRVHGEQGPRGVIHIAPERYDRSLWTMVYGVCTGPA